MNQQCLKLKPKRRRPTLAYCLALERRVLEMRLQIENMSKRLAKVSELASYRMGVRLAG